MPLLLAVISDEVWLALIGAIVSIATISSTIILAIIAFKTKQSVEKSAADAAHHVAEVKVQLQETTKANKETAAANDEKIEALTQKADQTLERVNGGMKAQLEINATTANTLAAVTQKPAHQEAARAADEALAAHMRTDAEVKANLTHEAYR